MAEQDDLVVVIDDEATPASTRTAPWHGGGETVMGTNYGPGTTPLNGGGEFGLMHGGTGTRPLDAGFSVTGSDPDEAPTRPSKMDLQAARRATAASLRAFATGHVEPIGSVAGVDMSHLARAREMVVEREAEARRRRTRAAETALHDMLNPEERKLI